MNTDGGKKPNNSMYFFQFSMAVDTGIIFSRKGAKSQRKEIN
jgi:hypothetical protein